MNGLKKALVFVVSMALLAGFFGIATTLFATEPISQSDITCTPAYRSMTIDWSATVSGDATTTTVFAVYRADDTQGTNARRVALLSSEKTSYRDTGLKPGKSYAYAVVKGESRKDLASFNTDDLAWSALQVVPTIGAKKGKGQAQASPHTGADIGTAARDQKGCNSCHVVHDSAASSTKLIQTSQSATEPDSETALCKSCHSDSTASESQWLETSLAQTSGHTIKNAKNPNGIFTCSTCHGAHQSSHAAKGALTAGTIKKFGSLKSDITYDATETNAACVSCHDDKGTWYKAVNSDAYPSVDNPTKLSGVSRATGMQSYPATGTYPGASVANSTTKSAHARIKASDDYDEGDCRYCHDGHANGQTDQLRADRGELRAMKEVGGVVSDEEKTSGDYASFCLSCHSGNNEGTPWESAQNVHDDFALPIGSTEESRTAFLESNAGHRIKTDSGDLPEGSALPCYACHNTHGSSTNAMSFTDELGTNLKNNDDFCFTCHVTSDGYVCEDGNDGTVVPFANAKKQEVYGLKRDGSDNSQLKLTDIEGHEKGSTRKCADCHGSAHQPNSYSKTCAPNNRACTDCHTSESGEYPSAAAYTSYTKAQAQTANTASYRWTVTHTAHLIPAWASYATNDSTTAGVYCTGCHGWATPSSASVQLKGSESGATLRNSFNGSQVARSDYQSTTTEATGGLCLSCHNSSSSSEAPHSGSTNTLATISATTYETSLHNYNVTISRKATSDGVASEKDKTYDANCVKCHNNAEPIADPANNLDKLQLNAHYTGGRLIANFGIRASIAKPATHDAILTTTCDTCHGTGKANVAHAGRRSGRCFEGCHSAEQIATVSEHKTQSWYSDCQTCHSASAKPAAHATAPASCSTTTCHSSMAAHVQANEGQCYSGCHAAGEIVYKVKEDGTLAHKATMTAFKNCGTCHTSSGTDAWTATLDTKGMCFGCHARKGQIAGNEGKSYTGKDWYGVEDMNVARGSWTVHTSATDATKTNLQQEYSNSSGTVIGTEYRDQESVLEDMYNTGSTAFQAGDGKGSTADAQALSALNSSMEVSGHQMTRSKKDWSSLDTLKPYFKNKTSSLRCAACHNTHSTSEGTMGGHSEWILTKKALPGKTGGVVATSYTNTSGGQSSTTVYADNTMPTQAIASDGSRLITLNDFWSRNELVAPVKQAIVKYYTEYFQSDAGGAMSATDAAAAAEAKYNRMDYNGITADQIAQATGTSATTGLAGQWAKTVDIFCYRCHDESGMANKAHQGTRTLLNTYSHKSASLACVNCHLPEVHGGKLEGLLSDRGAYDSDSDGIADANDASSVSTPQGMTSPYSSSAVTHKTLSKGQEFRWTAYQHGGSIFNSVNTTPKVLGNNQPTSMLFSVNPDPSSDDSWNYGGCSTDSSCHVRGIVTRYFGEQTGSSWLNWK